MSLKWNSCILKVSSKIKNIVQWHISNNDYFYSNFTYHLISCMHLKANICTVSDGQFKYVQQLLQEYSQELCSCSTNNNLFLLLSW